MGEGMFSTVYLCRDRLTDRVYACKRFRRFRMSKGALKNLYYEMRILSNLPEDCPHITRLYETVKTQSHFYLVIDYCNGGDIDCLLQERQRLSEAEVRHIYRQVMQAAKAMREMQVMHRDIKNANILLHYSTESREDVMSAEVKLADFGFSIALPDGLEIN